MELLEIYKPLILALQEHPFKKGIVKLNTVFIGYSNTYDKDMAAKTANQISEALKTFGISGSIIEKSFLFLKFYFIEVNIEEVRKAIILNRDKFIKEERFKKLIENSLSQRECFITRCESVEEAIKFRLLEYAYNGKLTLDKVNDKFIQDVAFNNLYKKSQGSSIYKNFFRKWGMLFGLLFSIIISVSYISRILETEPGVLAGGIIVFITVTATFIIMLIFKLIGNYLDNKYENIKSEFKLSNVDKIF